MSAVQSQNGAELGRSASSLARVWNLLGHATLAGDIGVWTYRVIIVISGAFAVVGAAAAAWGLAIVCLFCAAVAGLFAYLSARVGRPRSAPSTVAAEEIAGRHGAAVKEWYITLAIPANRTARTVFQEALSGPFRGAHTRTQHEQMVNLLNLLTRPILERFDHASQSLEASKTETIPLDALKHAMLAYLESYRALFLTAFEISRVRDSTRPATDFCKAAPEFPDWTSSTAQMRAGLERVVAVDAFDDLRFRALSMLDLDGLRDLLA